MPAFYVSLGTMPFTCQGDAEIRDASRLGEPEPARPQGSPKAGRYRFGLEVHIRASDNIPTTYFAAAAKGVSWSSPSYYLMSVMQSILSSWGLALGSAPLLSIHRYLPRIYILAHY